MKNILIINHNVQNCGVYQYGKRFASIAKKSNKINFLYYELSSYADLKNVIKETNPRVIIYNHLTGTMPWMTSIQAEEIRKQNIKQGLIVHNVNYETFFDFYLHQNPDYQETENNFSLCRPLFEYKPNKKTVKTDVINIGTFGFGFHTKHFDKICQIISNEFKTEPINLNFHLTISHFCPNEHMIVDIRNKCLSYIVGTNIRLNLTHTFITDEELLDMLYTNDLNIFLYEKYTSYNGISSSIDYALSVKKPIAICKSNMFSHIYNVEPSICVETNSLKNILANGFEPLKAKYNEWSHDNFIKNLENIVEKILYV
jgi:hypothetical protein